MVARIGVVTALMVTLGIVAPAAAQQRAPYVDMDVVELADCVVSKSVEIGQTPALVRDVDFEVIVSTGVIRVLGTAEQKAERRIRFADALKRCTPQKTAESR